MHNENLVDPNIEGTYRRGYHQAVADIANTLREKPLSADDLDLWVEGVGMNWRKDVSLERIILPPEINYERLFLFASSFI